MIAFEVWINGEKKCVAGDANLKVLSAILDGNPRHHDPSMSVGGIIGDDHVNWLRSDLKIGDEVNIRLIETDSPDEPIEYSRSETRVEREEKIEKHLKDACASLPEEAMSELELYRERMSQRHWMGAMDALEHVGDASGASSDFWKALSYAAHRQSAYEDCGRFSKKWKATKAAQNSDEPQE